MTRMRRLVRGWSAAAVLVLNTLLLLLVANLGAWLALEAVGANRHRVSPAYDGLMARGWDVLRTVYPGWADGDIEALLLETWTLPLTYEAYTQFRESPVRGRWVNVDAAGFRWNAPGRPPWPPPPGARTVFVFGGSTIFGYGLPDDATLPARLAARLAAEPGEAPAAIYNFGRAYYNSTQERVLLERLIAGGHPPDVALFIDGLNDTLLWPRYRDSPQHSEALRRFVERQRLNVGWGVDPAASASVREALGRLPLVRLARGVLRRAGRGADARREALEAAPGSDDELRRQARELAAVHAANRQLAAAAAATRGARALFVLQPVPWVRYDLSRHLFRPDAETSAGLERRFAASYAALRASAAGDLVDCSGALEGHPEPAYLDTHHYTAVAVEEVIDCLAAPLAAALAQPPPGASDELGAE